MVRARPRLRQSGTDSMVEISSDARPVRGRRAHAEAHVIRLPLLERQVGPVELQVPARGPATLRGETEPAPAVVRDDLLAAGGDPRRLERPSTRVRAHVLAEDLGDALPLSFPARDQALRRPVAHLQPGVPLPAKLGGVRLRQIVEVAGPERQRRVLVVHLHAQHRRLGRVGVPRVGVDVGEQAARVLLLRFDEGGIETIEHLPHVEPLGRRTVEAGIAARHVEVQVHVDPVARQLGDEEVEPIELGRVEPLAIGGDEADRRRPLVHEVQPHDVHAQAPQVRRRAGGDLVSGKAGGGGAVDPEEPDTCAAAVDEVAVRRADEAARSGGRPVQVRQIDGAGRRADPARGEREPAPGIVRVVGGGRNDDRT